MGSNITLNPYLENAFGECTKVTRVVCSLHSSGALSVGNLTTVGVNHRAETTPVYFPAVPIDRLKSPSQANCLSTTVPQNIAAPAISGRHTPTRSSLRHSRMIVLSRNGKGERTVWSFQYFEKHLHFTT